MNKLSTNEVVSVKLVERGVLITFQDGLVALFPDALLTTLVSNRVAELEEFPAKTDRELPYLIENRQNENGETRT